MSRRRITALAARAPYQFGIDLPRAAHHFSNVGWADFSRRHQAEVTQAAIQAVEPHEWALAARAAHLFADHVVAIHGGRIAQARTFPGLETGSIGFSKAWKTEPPRPA